MDIVESGEKGTVVAESMNHSFFISDAHLGFSPGEQEQLQERALHAFFDHVAERGKHLYILGDLFDFWFEYEHVIPKRYFGILYRLRELVLLGTRIVYIVGNHDFAVSSFFTDELGIEVVTQPLNTDLDGRRLYIAHGDGLLRSDRGSRMLHRILRHPLNRHLFRLLHPDLGFRLARSVSRMSRNHSVTTVPEDEYLEFARARFDEGFDSVILAHTHQPVEIHEHGHTYINTGEWITRFTYGDYDGKRLQLKTWKPPQADPTGQEETA